MNVYVGRGSKVATILQAAHSGCAQLGNKVYKTVETQYSRWKDRFLRTYDPALLDERLVPGGAGPRPAATPTPPPGTPSDRDRVRLLKALAGATGVLDKLEIAVPAIKALPKNLLEELGRNQPRPSAEVQERTERLLQLDRRAEESEEGTPVREDWKEVEDQLEKEKKQWAKEEGSLREVISSQRDSLEKLKAQVAQLKEVVAQYEYDTALHLAYDSALSSQEATQGSDAPPAVSFRSSERKDVMLVHIWSSLASGRSASEALHILRHLAQHGVVDLAELPSDRYVRMLRDDLPALHTIWLAGALKDLPMTLGHDGTGLRGVEMEAAVVTQAREGGGHDPVALFIEQMPGRGAAGAMQSIESGFDFLRQSLSVLKMLKEEGKFSEELGHLVRLISFPSPLSQSLKRLLSNCSLH